MFLKKLTATAVVSLGDASPRSVGRIVFQVVGSTWVGSVLVKARAADSGSVTANNTPIANADCKSVTYIDKTSGLSLPAAVPITGDGIYEVDANGLEIVLDYTHSSGSANVYVWPLEGAGSALSLNEPRDLTILSSAARTTTQTSADLTNLGARGATVVLDVTEVSAGPDITLTIEAKDPTSGKYYTVLAGASVTTVSTNVYRIYPGLAVTTNVSANAPLPRIWRTTVTANNANAGTYSLGASLLL